ncbi:hypothetical protein EZS27_024278, partial [termite gut metagenome]
MIFAKQFAINFSYGTYHHPDNGSEFAEHEFIAKKLKANFYGSS